VILGQHKAYESHTHTQLGTDLAGSHFTFTTGLGLSELRDVLCYRCDQQPSEVKLNK